MELFPLVFFFLIMFCSLHLSEQEREPQFFQVHPCKRIENILQQEYFKVPGMLNHFINSALDTVVKKESCYLPNISVLSVP